MNTPRLLTMLFLAVVVVPCHLFAAVTGKPFVLKEAFASYLEDVVKASGVTGKR